MNIITLTDISKSYSEKTLLDNVSLGINDGDKIGLIGINGAGKSTFLKIICGKDEFFNGDITKKKNARIEYLKQTPDFDPDLTVLQQIFRADTMENKILLRYENIVYKINNNKNEDLEKLNKELIELQSKIDSLNLWTLESQAKTVLTKLGINNYSEKMKNLSGGQKKRVALAAALITKCDVLVLDEPTNHLDSESIEWLEDYLNSRKGALLMITHDRYFLDRVTNRILELDNGKLYSYPGNYTDFLNKKIERFETLKSQDQKRKSLIRNELKWVKRGAKARSTKQKARLQRFEKLVNTESLRNPENVTMEFVGKRLGKKIVEIHNICKTYEKQNIINDFTYTFLKGDRIGIIGPNGAGKTTLVNILCGKINSDSGDIDIGDTVKIGCFSQDSTNMDENERVIDYVKDGGEFIEVSDGSKISASTMCERFLFTSDMQYTFIGKLSGGERRRLYLLRVLMESPNFLILDEPTNDLDIETLRILEDFLDKFNGVILTVSHDRYFLDRVTNKIFSYEGNGKIQIYHGNYSDYLIQKEIEKPEKVEKQETEVKKDAKCGKVKIKDNKPKFTFKEQKEFEEIDGIISSIESKIEELDKEIENNPTDYEKLNKCVEEKNKLNEELDLKMQRWEYLNEKAEEIKTWRNSDD
ncbi:ABC-F family ATP-binding cassette domain-containing protein [Clostridium sp. BJN0001]|uniref:ABC transporter ATP-binding protein n=1 Tax=Clostridium sp. BJN0001 TaxID=2930219 RepID=UPI001FD1CE0D|nr:ABC-F family ATP-binding cassette domain-containing protein [Clostridium sp. BJN0001]